MNRQPFEPSADNLQERMTKAIAEAHLLFKRHRKVLGGASVPGPQSLRVLLTYVTSPSLVGRFEEDLDTALRAWRAHYGPRSRPDMEFLLAVMDATADHRADLALDAMMADEEPEPVLAEVPAAPEPEEEPSPEEEPAPEPEEGKAIADRRVRKWLEVHGEAAGVVDLSLLDGMPKGDVLAMPGMGPNLCKRLEAALAAQGLALA